MAQSRCPHRTPWALTSSAALVLLAWSGPAQALNLGRLKVLSGLGEPLQAEVTVVEATAAELSGLQAQVGTPGEFAQAGMEFSPALQGASVSLQAHDGLPYLLVQGRQPVQAHFLDLIIQAQWNGGKLQRNYALLLSGMETKRQRTPAAVEAAQLPVSSPLTPSTITPDANTQALMAARQVPANGTTIPAPARMAEGVPAYTFSTPTAEPTPAPAQNIVAPAVEVQPRAARHSSNDPVEVQSGDTASEIAVRTLPASVSLDQMLVAMAKANPDSFIKGNVNLVRAGSTLRMPSANDAQQVSRQEARQIILAQTRDFVAYTQRLARATIQVDQASTNEMSGRLSTPETSVKEAESKPDRLTLSQATLNTEQEARIAKAREGQDKQNELQALQKNMAELQDLAKNKDTGTGASVNLPQPAAKPEVTPSVPDTSPLLDKLKNDPRTLAWGAALLAALMALAWWVRGNKRSPRGQMAYAPSYDDIPATATTEPGSDTTPSPLGMPKGFAGLNLDLNSPPSAPPPASVAPMVAPVPSSPVPAPADQPAQDTSVSKLQLAQQLLQQGEKDLARALLLSTLKSPNPGVQSQALQLLNTLQ